MIYVKWLDRTMLLTGEIASNLLKIILLTQIPIAEVNKFDIDSPELFLY